MGQDIDKPDDSGFRDDSMLGRLIEQMHEINARILTAARTLAGRIYRRIRSPRTAGAIAAYDRGAYEVAFHRFRQLAERGHVDAQYYLGLMYSEGQGTASNEIRAMHWFAKAAEQGDSDAAFICALRV